MRWTVCAAVSLLTLLTTIVLAIRNRRKRQGDKWFWSPFRILVAGLFLSALVCIVPIYFQAKGRDLLRTGLASLHTTFQIFTVDVDSESILAEVRSGSEMLNSFYSLYLGTLFIVAPVLTLGFIFSIIGNLFASFSYLRAYFSDLYVFSELNEKSLALARDLKANHPDAAVVFADVNDEENKGDDIESAKELGAIRFRKGLTGINLTRHAAGKKITVFVIGEDQVYNINLGLKMIDVLRDTENAFLYIFSTRVESEILLTKANKGKLRVRRINEVRSLIYNMLYENGPDLFRNAKPGADGQKTITAVIVGMGKHGSEMLKALAWYCQMDGYAVKIHAFEKDPLIEDRLKAECPELLSEEYNGVTIPGEAQYTIRIHPDMDATTNTFTEEIRKIPDVTYALAALGTDEDNIRTAVDLRKTFERIGVKPVIEAIVYSSEEKKALEGITNFKKQAYDISFIGDLRSTYSEKVVISSELEQEAYKKHLKYARNEEEKQAFWQYEYNYRSSVATAIHDRARVACGMPGAGKTEGERTAEEAEAISIIEHRRWNAYMRSEGYIHGAERNDLGKMHHDLVRFDSLTEKEKKKDSDITLA